eukprot:COSAG02_NODE_913_length_15994_cov_6.140484_12_plen_660_part_00
MDHRTENLHFAQEPLAAAFALAKEKLAQHRSDEATDADLSTVIDLLSCENQATQRLAVTTLGCFATASEAHVAEMVRLGAPAALWEVYKQTLHPSKDDEAARQATKLMLAETMRDMMRTSEARGAVGTLEGYSMLRADIASEPLVDADVDAALRIMRKTSWENQEMFIDANLVAPLLNVIKEIGPTELRVSATIVVANLFEGSLAVTKAAVEAGGLEMMIAELANTSLDAELAAEMTRTIEKVTHHAEFAKRLVDAGVCAWLLPTMYCAEPGRCFTAACIVANLHQDRAVIDQIHETGCLEDIEKVARTLYPGALTERFKEECPQRPEFEVLRTLISSDLPLPVRLVAAICLCGYSVHAGEDSDDSRQVVRIYEDPEIIQSLRVLAASTDGHIYLHSIFALRNLGLPEPYFKKSNGSETASTLPAEVAEWSTDDVCTWVGQQEFSMYRKQFRSGLVNGAVLIKLDTEHLEEMGISRRVHRTVILTGIELLSSRIQSEGTAEGTLVEGVPPAMRSKQALQVDVFISYRRKGGSQLAQLIKVFLKLRGYAVFLDVDNLGRGEFDTALEANLNAARNVVVLLTDGCLDRCIEDTENQDFVRREIATALAKKKNVVPVTAAFTWPDTERLPHDIRELCRQNAVDWSHQYQDASIEKLCAFLHK